MPVLELAEAPRLKTGDDVLGFVIGERLGTDEPGALQDEDQDQQRDDHCPAAAGREWDGGWALVYGWKAAHRGIQFRLHSDDPNIKDWSERKLREHFASRTSRNAPWEHLMNAGRMVTEFIQQQPS